MVFKPQVHQNILTFYALLSYLAGLSLNVSLSHLSLETRERSSVLSSVKQQIENTLKNLKEKNVLISSYNTKLLMFQSSKWA